MNAVNWLMKICVLSPMHGTPRYRVAVSPLQQASQSGRGVGFSLSTKIIHISCWLCERWLCRFLENISFILPLDMLSQFEGPTHKIATELFELLLINFKTNTKFKSYWYSRRTQLYNIKYIITNPYHSHESIVTNHSVSEMTPSKVNKFSQKKNLHYSFLVHRLRRKYPQFREIRLSVPMKDPSLVIYIDAQQPPTVLLSGSEFFCVLLLLCATSPVESLRNAMYFRSTSDRLNEQTLFLFSLFC